MNIGVGTPASNRNLGRMMNDGSYQKFKSAYKMLVISLFKEVSHGCGVGTWNNYCWAKILIPTYVPFPWNSQTLQVLA
jgi:hypothetical protein